MALPFPPKLGEISPELHALRDRLLAGVIVFDDIPLEWGRLLLNLPNDAPAWSRADALLAVKTHSPQLQPKD